MDRPFFAVPIGEPLRVPIDFIVAIGKGDGDAAEVVEAGEIDDGGSSNLGFVLKAHEKGTFFQVKAELQRRACRGNGVGANDRF